MPSRSRTLSLVVLAALATMCGAPPSLDDEIETARTEGDEPPAQGTDGANEDTTSPAEGPEPEETAGTEDGVPTAPTVSTEISFDLRGMPHRGPHDVDPARIDSRREYLMQQVRDAAGEPAPRLMPSAALSTFTAEFFGPEAHALVQCRRVVAEVAPLPGPQASRRMAVRLPTATPCVAIERTGQGAAG